MTCCAELRQLSEKQRVPVDLDTYIKKLANSRKRVLLVNDILLNVQVSVQISAFFLRPVMQGLLMLVDTHLGTCREVA